MKEDKNKKRMNSLTLEILSSGGFLVVNKKILSKFGPDLSIYLSNLIDKYKYFQNREMLNGNDLSFFVTYSQQSRQTGMTEYQLRKCKNKLKKMKIITTEMRGIPPKEFYILNIGQLTDIISELNNKPHSFENSRNYPLETKGIMVKNSKELSLENSRNIKDNKYKDNKYNNKKNIYLEKENQEKLNVLESGSPISNQDETFDKKSIKERNKEFVPFANRLADIVKSNRNIKVDQTKINTWANEIRKLAETDGVNPRRIGDALDWYQDNIGGAYIPVIYSGAAFRSKFLALEDAMNRAGIITHAPTTKHASSPQKLLRKHFPNDTLRKAFYRNCCAPAKHLLGVHEPLEMTDVVKTLVNLHVQITQAQDKNLSADLRKIFPGSLDLIANYIDWVNGQHWIENLQLKMFDLNDGRFSKFRRYQAEEDHMERDPLTGKSYLRG